MASHGQPTLETPEPPDFAPGAQFVEYEEFIETQLRRTRSHVRSVDLAAGVMLLLAGTLSYFLLATLVDHWLFTGGLGFWGRLVLFLGFVAGATWWIATQLVPLVIKRINPLYAAHTIERSRPSLKNSLVNFLLFRSEPGAVHQRVLEAIEEQAATNLVGVQVDSAVDRSRLIKLGYVLIGIFALCAVYAVVSPKNMFKTVGRVVMPWADILPPTRTTIDEIEPGDVQAFRGQQVTVKANVQGVAEGSPVTLYYTTADRQIVERPIEMSRPAGEYRYTAVLPAADAELQQSLTYTIKAGDATTRTYSVDVVAAPTIVVKSVEYKYPAYTGLLTQRIEHQGDLKAIEGTEVTLETLANQDIASGYVDFDANNSLDLPLRGEGPRAKASFKLLLKEDRQSPEHASYQLTFKNAAGQQNPQPIRHQIEVTRDVSPEVQFVAPERDEVEVPVDGAIDLEVVANDPDFALASVKLLMLKGKKQAEEKLLNEAWRGQFVKKYHFQPSKLKLKVGDTIEYWAVAVDNKSPRANQSETARRKIVVVAPTASANDANTQAADGGEQAAGGGENGKPGDDPSKADNSKQAGEESSPKSEAADPASEPKAGEEPQANDGAQGAEAASAEKSPEQQPQQGEKPQPGAGEPGADSGEGASQAGDSGEAQAGEKPSAGEQADGGAASQGEKGAGEEGANEKGGSEAGAGEPQDSVASDGTNDGDAFERILQDREEQAKQQPQDGEQQPGGEQQQGEQQQGEQQQGEQQQGGEQNSSEPQAGDKQSQQQGGDQQGEAGEQDKQQGGQKGGQQQQGEDQQQGKSQGGQQQGGKQQGGKQSDAQKSGGQKSDGAGQSQQGEKSDGAQGEGEGQQGKSAGEKSQGDAASGQKPDGKQGDAQQQGQGQQKGQGEKGQSDPNAKPSDTQGEGAQSKGDSNNSGGKPEAAPKGEQRSDARGGDGESEKGESGAGQESSDKQGSPGAQDANAPRDKSSQSRQQGGEKNDSEEQSPTNSKRESDTEGDEDGDRSGGGKRGGGQKANQSGTGGAGQNTAADEGADRSEQAGGSETSGRAGEDQAADGKTGKSGEQQGAGSKQRPAGENGAPGGEQSQPSDGSKAGGKQQGEAADGKATESADGAPSDQAGEQASDSQQGEPSGEPGEGSEAAQQGGQQKSAGGTRSDGAKASQEEGVGTPDENSEGAEAAEPNGQGSKSIVPPKREWEAGTDKADQANLEYTRKATDLAIKHLKDELAKGPADPKVLDKLGWTRQDAEKFVERWEAMRSGAKSTEKAAPGGTRPLDDALRSLGLRPRSTTLSGSAARDDRTQGLEESRRTKPPAEYSEAFKAYTQGTTRGGK